MSSLARYLGSAVQFVILLALPVGLAGQQPDTPPAVADSLAPAAGDTLATDSLPPRPPLAESADSVLQLLRQLEGFTVTEYRGTAAEYRVDTGVLRLEGAAEVTRGSDRLTADTIIYREGLELVEAYGSPTVTGEGQELTGDTLYYDLASRRATALGARTQISETATWHVQGDVTLEGESHLYGSHARFTSCDLAIPHYHFESDEVMVIRDQILVARPARLYFGNVPVMVLPFVVHNLEQGRRSGFLTPRFGVHDVIRASSGYNRQISNVGFYWAINEYMGAQLSTTWRSGAYTAILGDYQFRWRRQFLDGRVAFEQYWEANGDQALNLDANGSWRPDERTNLNLSGRYATSEAFVREASYDPQEVTQDLQSRLSLSRTFDWGTASLGAERRQSIANGDVTMTLPSLSLSPQKLTLFRETVPEQASWYSNATFTPGVVTFSRSANDYTDEVERNRQDQNTTRFRVSPSFSVGNLTFSASGQLNRAEILAAAGAEQVGALPDLPGFTRDEAAWSAEARYQQTLIGSTSISPKISLGQDLVRDTLTSGELLRAPMRLSFGADLNTDLYGFFPGIGNLTAIRHKLSPRLSYEYSPEVAQTELQESVFGQPGGRAQNVVTLGISQTWEGKLREPREVAEPTIPVDSIVADSLATAPEPSVPSDPEKVLLLSLNTSAVAYDFIRAREEGTGFATTTISNSISSDYLRGLTIQTQHELFDRTDLDPNVPENVGRLGIFAPRLTSLSTSFRLGPETAVVRWLERFGIGNPDEGLAAGEGVVPGEEPEAEPAPEGQGGFTNNPQGTGGGPWSAGIGYRFSRPSRAFAEVPRRTSAVQTLDGNIEFQLSPNWSVGWDTSYSITDGEFGRHQLNFQRDLHEWQANFNFYQTPNGNSAFEFYVELTHNRDLRFDYAERNLGIDRN